MKTCSTLFMELLEKKNLPVSESGTAKLLQKGHLAVCQKLVEESAEIWMAVRFEGKDDIALEISQFWYHLMVFCISSELFSGDVLKILQQVDEGSWRINIHDKPNKELIHSTVNLILNRGDDTEKFQIIHYLFRLSQQIASEKEINKESIFKKL